jgi:hypothetical protein
MLDSESKHIKFIKNVSVNVVDLTASAVLCLSFCTVAGHTGVLFDLSFTDTSNLLVALESTEDGHFAQL